MSQKPLFQQLQARWPATEDYLERVGQVNNDLMTVREVEAYENHVPDFLEVLAISESDLTSPLRTSRVMAMLHLRGIEIESRMTVQTFQEFQKEYEREKLISEEREDEYNPNPMIADSYFNILENPYWNGFSESVEKELEQLPEFQQKLLQWATNLTQRTVQGAAAPSLEQAFQIAHLTIFLDQESATPDLREESLRSLLSTEFYRKAGNQPPAKSLN